MKLNICIAALGILALLSVDLFAQTEPRILLYEGTWEEYEDADLAPLPEITRWDYRGPVLGSFAEADRNAVSGGLKISFPFECFSTLGRDLREGAVTIYDQTRGSKRTLAALYDRNPGSFFAQEGGIPKALPPGEARRLDNAQAEGPGLFQRPSTYLTGLGVGVAAWIANEQISGNSAGGTTINQTGNGNSVALGGDSSADNSNRTTNLPGEQVAP